MDNYNNEAGGKLVELLHAPADQGRAAATAASAAFAVAGRHGRAAGAGGSILEEARSLRELAPVAPELVGPISPRLAIGPLPALQSQPD